MSFRQWLVAAAMPADPEVERRVVEARRRADDSVDRLVVVVDELLAETKKRCGDAATTLRDR